MMTRIYAMAGGCAGALLLLSTPASSQELPSQMGDRALAEERGGFVTVNGVTLDFGAVVRTYVNGVLAVQTRLTWTPAGPVTDHSRGDVAGAVSLGEGAADARSRGLDLSGLMPGSEGVIISDANGATALVHSLANGAVQNLVLNAANDRNIQQDVQLTLTLPGFESVQSSYGVEQLGSRIAQDIDLSMLQAIRP